ncbi:hypothetical protein EV360DRAFT_72355 [Lentinula raphanica]|nr:hypothetical protein EV360DRAFT_72355 [Lentinula raphanica]
MTRPKFIFPTLGIIFVFLASTATPEVIAAPVAFNNDSEIVGRLGDDGVKAGSDGASRYPAPTSSSSSLAGAGAGQGGTASDAIEEEQLTGSTTTGDAPNPQSWDPAASTAAHGFETAYSRVELELGRLIPRAAASTDTDESSSSSLTLKRKKKGKGKAVHYEDNEYRGRYSKQRGKGKARFYHPSSRMRQFKSESSSSSSGSSDYSSISGSSGSSSGFVSSSGSSSESGPSTARGHRPRPPTVRHSEAAPSHAAPSPSHNTQQTIFDELEATLQGYEAELNQMIAQSVTFGVFREFVTRVDELATDISQAASPAHRSDAQWPALIDRVQKLSFECKEAAKRAGIAYNRGLGREDAVHAIASGQISYDELHHNYRPVYAPPTQEAGPSHQGQEGSAWHAPGSGAHTQQSGGGYSYYGTWPAHGDEGHGYGEHGYDAYGYEGHGYEGHGYEGHGYEGHGYGDQGYGQHRYGEHAYGENGNENHGYGEHTYEGHTYGGHGNEPWPENGQYGH